MAWRVARSALTLRDQINAAAPLRSKLSDGTIGDADHQKRSSDHNPWVPPPDGGVVTAIDITHDPANGCDTDKLADAIKNDPRVKFIIRNGRIWNPLISTSWRAYIGTNPHVTHMHVSVDSSPASVYDSTMPWPGLPMTVPRDWLAEGDRGNRVREWQVNLVMAGFYVVVDGIFGPATRLQTVAFQAAARLTTDGLVGAQTLAAMSDWIERRGTVDFEVAVVAHSDVDEGMAWALGQTMGLKVLRTGHIVRARRAFLVGAAAFQNTAGYQESRPVAGVHRQATAVAVAQLLEDYYEAGRPRGLRALTF